MTVRFFHYFIFFYKNFPHKRESTKSLARERFCASILSYHITDGLFFGNHSPFSRWEMDLYSTNVMAQFRPALIRLKGMIAGSSMGITSSMDVPKKIGVSTRFISTIAPVITSAPTMRAMAAVFLVLFLR